MGERIEGPKKVPFSSPASQRAAEAAAKRLTPDQLQSALEAWDQNQAFVRRIRENYNPGLEDPKTRNS
jgi:hypothetical protein